MRLLRLMPAALAIFLSACSSEYLSLDSDGDLPSGEFSESFTVGFCADGGVATKTSMNEDGLSTSWDASDKIAVWARNSYNSYTLSGQTFHLYGKGESTGVFTSTLSSPMPDDDYTYYAVYPEPKLALISVVCCDIPAEQDGLCGGGSDIMIAEPAQGGALAKLAANTGRPDLHMSFRHVLHRLRFYIPEGCNILGEPVLSLTITMPRPIAGTVALNVANPDELPIFTDMVQNAIPSTNTITLSLSTPLDESIGKDRQYVAASIFPTYQEYGEDDYLNVTINSLNYKANLAPIPLNGRTFEAGHSTAVRLVGGEIEKPEVVGRLILKVGENNIGEAVQKVQIMSGSDVLCECKNTDGTYDNFWVASEYVGDEEVARYEQICSLIAAGGATLKMETEHAIVRRGISASAISKEEGTATITLGDVPYLLYEDFSTVGSFSSNDEYSDGVFNKSKTAYSFLNGWTGGRIGAQNGCIRIAPRQENMVGASGTYDARVDSAPLLQLKKETDIVFEFDYGYNNQYKTSSLFGSGGDFPMNAYIGYVTSAKAYDSGDTDGVYVGNSIYSGSTKDADWNTPHHYVGRITGMPAGSENRISWRGSVTTGGSNNNTTCWFYIDNVKVYIAK